MAGLVCCFIFELQVKCTLTSLFVMMWLELTLRFNKLSREVSDAPFLVSKPKYALSIPFPPRLIFTLICKNQCDDSQKSKQPAPDHPGGQGGTELSWSRHHYRHQKRCVQNLKSNHWLLQWSIYLFVCSIRLRGKWTWFASSKISDSSPQHPVVCSNVKIWYDKRNTKKTLLKHLGQMFWFNNWWYRI